MADGSQLLDLTRPSEPTSWRVTFQDVRRMMEAELLPPDLKFEVIDGEIILIPSEGELHIDWKMLLTQWAVRTVARPVYAYPDATLYLDDENLPEPDLYLYERHAGTHPISIPHLHLVVEIADSSKRHDLHTKGRLYARYGVREYWVGDIRAAVTHVFRDPVDGDYPEAARVPFTEPLQVRSRPGMTLVMADLPNG